MGRWIHRLSGLDEEKSTAQCAQCGPVEVRLTIKGGGRKQWRCLEVLRASARKWSKSPKGREYHRKYMNAWNAADPSRLSKANRKNLLAQHGLTLADYDQMVADRNGKCDLCGETPETLCVDHDHATLRIRGLLCMHCNLALGLLRDRPEVALRVPAYLGMEATPRDSQS